MRLSFKSLILLITPGFLKMDLTSQTIPFKPPAKHNFIASSKEFLLTSVYVSTPPFVRKKT
ncbi:hypothetical protein Hanom_Chr06g00506721 [Helianthus anomalus]